MILLQQTLHYFLHLIFPAIVAYFLFRKKWKRAYLIMLASMIVDLDHLLANPVFDPCRCSIGFHPLHTYLAIGIYCIFLCFSFSRIIAIGLLLHMATDYIDCLFIKSNCSF